MQNQGRAVGGRPCPCPSPRNRICRLPGSWKSGRMLKRCVCLVPSHLCWDDLLCCAGVYASALCCAVLCCAVLCWVAVLPCTSPMLVCCAVMCCAGAHQPNVSVLCWSAVLGWGAMLCWGVLGWGALALSWGAGLSTLQGTNHASYSTVHTNTHHCVSHWLESLSCGPGVLL